MNDAAAFARRMWIRFETYHDVTYFTPEARAAADALGCKGGWMGYFGTRAAPMGAVAPEVVVSAFYNFHPSLVHRALPTAWEIAEPARFLDARLTGADGALRRMLGPDTIDGPDLAEAAELATAAAAATPTVGRPLAVANALLPQQTEPHLALWQAATLLRESRGDGHVAALIVAGLDPCEALVMFGADHGLDPSYLRAARAWPEPGWQAATNRLIERGLLADGRLTSKGTDLRHWIEQATDEAAAAPWQALGETRAERLRDLLTPIARRLAEANDAMRANPMGLDAARELAA
jgi:hypothetical protein